MGTGYEIDGGSGGPNQNIFFENIIAWDNTLAGFNVQKNDDGTTLSYGTLGQNSIVGVRFNPYPGASSPITNGTIRNCYAVENGTGGGFFYGNSQVTTFVNNTSVNHVGRSDIEPQFAPLLNYLVRPDHVSNRSRGATVTHRYIDGVLTDEQLWPWPLESIIKEHMCNQTDLATVHRSVQDIPAWCASDQTLTEYIWEYLGNPMPPNPYLQLSAPKNLRLSN